ncbi:sugar transferase [Shewanella algae]|uniref:sugar transferase n=1 Tax=Shewanella algae TaxID=38313 RepID=UPI000BB62033|nr:sugar transferase [Shewanella algae]PBQ28616.1 sugar transferase [Shewanella algae]
MYNRLVKRTLDFMVALSFIILLSPLFLIIAILIYLNSGRPIIYKQIRIGRGVKEFYIYKFRTMIVNADKVGPTSTKINDSRITPIGRFLRKYSLDELPQLFNVLLGDMSLIGYRPGVLDGYSADFLNSSVFSMRPGITGLAQVSGRSVLKAEDKRKLEIEYSENVGFLLDIKIIYLTFVKVIFGKNAY